LADGKPFGVNLYISMRGEANARLEDLVEVVCEEKIPFVETSGGHPGEMLPYLKEAGIKVLHKVPAVRYARSAAKAGVDAVILIGAESGGHPGPLMIGSWVQGAEAPRVLDVPIILGGGVGTGGQLAAALAMGCEGVLLGTRMLVADEIPAHEAYKQTIAAGDGSESVVVRKIHRSHHRVLANEATAEILALEEQGVTEFEPYASLVAGETTQHAYQTGDLRRGMIDYGQGACFAEESMPAEAIIDQLIDEAAEALKGLEQKLRP
jgi:nitronate monooxygenase